MASIVLKTLSVLLGLFFIFVGLIKITPKLSRDMHRDIRKSFVQYAKVFPMAQWFGFKVSSKWFRRSVGIVETICGLALLFLPGCFKQLANLVLLLLMIGAVFIHHTIGDRFERTAPAIVFTFMLTCRLVVYLQVRRKASREAKAAAAAADLASPSTSAATPTSTIAGDDSFPKKLVKQD